ncbi:hypothetical protein [Eubacterium sp. Marseille-QA0814]|uniref:hypothetical protein n=1 Tax=Eubacterium sp. Marseille-QA0814 TaxID=3378778 RepID=UPI003D0CAFE5
MLSKLVEIDASDKISSPSDIKDYGFTKKNEEITGSTNNITVTDSNGKNYEFILEVSIRMIQRFII